MAGNNFVLAVSPERKVVETRNHLRRVQNHHVRAGAHAPKIFPTLRFGDIPEKPYRIEGNVGEFRNQDLPPLNQGQGFRIRWNFSNRTFRSFHHIERMGTDFCDKFHSPKNVPRNVVRSTFQVIWSLLVPILQT